MGGDLNPGPATTQEPQVPFGHPTGSGVTPLPQILDLTCAQSLRDTLVSLLGKPAILLDAGGVERMSTPCAQVLLAAGRASGSDGAGFRIVNPSVAFRAAIADLGLQPEFSKWMD